MHHLIAAELIQLAKYDLEVRQQLQEENKLSPGYNPEMEAVHKQNAARLKQLIAQIGWPTIPKVGKEASEAAWLIVQHSIGDPVFIKSCYALLEQSAGTVNPQQLAYLHDRICYFEGKPQKYGTQYEDKGLYPVEDKNKVNALRTKLALKPHSMDIITEATKTELPTDLHTDPEFNAWRKKVGWI
ncbi:hypothetical protein GXP67_18305 [Rhodocytophaga rosea]|uniref:Uncharacterized protein n=1 Tax=Rhodocytophaga rosea TaxID=2704465 RepID=A0A6C0GKW5_9BACT|nr:DUF6624 domain-containing protein [Rhodocytophaga rosea]QHT68454.1 hypothetical protein GXP67_18305 [Rhodocytophaga rosea]